MDYEKDSIDEIYRFTALRHELETYLGFIATSGC